MTGGDDKTVRVWDLESGMCLRTLEGHRDWVSRVSVTPDGRRVAFASAANNLVFTAWAKRRLRDRGASSLPRL